MVCDSPFYQQWHHPLDKTLFINPFYTQLQHNRRHPEFSELSFLFNCFRPLHRITVSLPRLSFILHCCFLLPPPSHPSLHLFLPLASLPLFAEQPSSGQLLIRGRNDRCFAHQQCYLFCLSTNSSCAVHIYFSWGVNGGLKEHTYLRINKCIHAHTNTYPRPL